MRGGAGLWGWGGGIRQLSLPLCRPLFEGENEFCLYLEELFSNLKVECTAAVGCPCTGRWKEVVVMGRSFRLAADQEAPAH